MATNYLSGDVVMVGKDHDIVKDTRLHLQNVRNLNIIIEVLDDKNKVLDTIHGIVDTGSISVNGESLIRRTGSITMTMIDKVIPRNGNLIWLTNKIRVYVGIRDNVSIQSEDITHYCVGTFHVSQASTTVAQDGKTVSVNLEDYMMRWEIEQLEENIAIEAEVPLHIAVINTMNMLGEFNLDVEMTNVNVPMDLEFSIGDSVSSVIQTLRDLYMDYECYYTVDGVFTFKKMKVQLENGEDVKWQFNSDKDLSVSIAKTYNFKDIKNVVKVVGRTLNDGSTVMGEYSLKDASNPFHSDNIGRRLKVVNDTSLFTTAQCESMAVYELHNSSNMQETFSITTVPIYFLDANDIIEVYNEERESFDRMVIKSLNFNLEVGSTMSISANKLYYNTFDITPIPIELYRAIADEIVEKIKTKGWLSLAENRIYEYYGLQGKGNTDVMIRFQYQERYGVTAYVVAYPNSTTQALVIDLADYHSVEGDSGDNNNGKGDYADRVLGHETLHLVMNNDFGMKKTSQIPEWYREGMAELLHGADERTKNVIVEGNAINEEKLQEVINKAYSLLIGSSSFKSESADYVAGYILCKIIAKKIKENNSTFQDFHDTIRVSKESGDVAFNTALLTHVGDMMSLAQYVSNNGVNFVKNEMHLDIGIDEIDTGSIAGSDYGGRPLNAEDVFDNSLAEQGVFLKRFNVIVEKP